MTELYYSNVDRIYFIWDYFFSNYIMYDIEWNK